MQSIETIREKVGSLTTHCGSYYIPVPFVAPFAEREMSQIHRELLNLPWVSPKTARHECFMSGTPRSYSYGNKGVGTQEYTSIPFSMWVAALMQRSKELLGADFNVCFLNKYDNEHQHLGWHSDVFEGMIEGEPIGVVSFGAEREIWMRVKGDGGVVPPENRLKLEQGSLFVMPPGYQDTHQHRIPKHSQPCGWRVSLTFRTFK